MQIIISALHFPWRDIADCLTTVKDDLCLDGVELSLHESFTHPHTTREELAALPELAATGDLQIDAHIWEDLPQMGVDAGAERLLEWVAICRQSKITGIILHGGSHPDQRAGLAIIRQIFDKVMGQVERKRVVLKLENHYPYTYHDCHELFSAPWEFAELFAAVDSPWLRACFDTGHAHMAHNWAPLLDAMAPRLSHIHLADNGGVDDDHRAYRLGTVPWDGMLAHWQNMGFDGTFCLEFPVRDDRAPFTRCLADLAVYRAETTIAAANWPRRRR